MSVRKEANERQKQRGKQRASNDSCRPRARPSGKRRRGKGRTNFLQSRDRLRTGKYGFVDADIKLFFEIEHQFDTIKGTQAQLVERRLRRDCPVGSILPEKICNIAPSS